MYFVYYYYISVSINFKKQQWDSIELTTSRYFILSDSGTYVQAFLKEAVSLLIAFHYRILALKRINLVSEIFNSGENVCANRAIRRIQLCILFEATLDTT